MDLHDEPGLQPLRPQPLEHLYHSQLDDVRRRALDGHVQGHPLPEGPGGEVYQLAVPLTAEAHSGRNWLEAK